MMKSIRLIIGIFCLAMIPLMSFNSFYEVVKEIFSDDGQITNSTESGILMIILMILSGITSIVTHKKIVGSLITTIIIFLTGLYGLINGCNKSTANIIGSTFLIVSIIYGISTIISAIKSEESSTP